MNATLEEYRQSRFVCGAHLAKTAGSSLAGHAKENLGDGVFFRLGRFSRIARFLDGLPQLEDLPETERSKIAMLFGHGVDFGAALMVPGRLPDYVIATRHPVALYRSRFFNHVKRAQRMGTDLDFAEFAKRPDQPNRFCQFVVQHFSEMAGGTQEVSLENVTEILRHFRFVFVTEQISAQSQVLWSLLGLPEEMTRRRVAPAAARKELPEFDPAEIETRHALDLEVFNLLNSADWQAEAARSRAVNGLGFDEERLRARVDAARQRAPTPEAQRARAYGELVRQMHADLQVEAVELKMAQSDLAHLGDPDLLLRIMDAEPPHKGTRQSAAVSKVNAGRFALKGLGQSDLAKRYAADALDIVPRFKPANALLRQAKRAEA